MTDSRIFGAVLTDQTAQINDMSIDGYIDYCTNVARLVNEGTEEGLAGDALRAYVNRRLVTMGVNVPLAA